MGFKGGEYRVDILGLEGALWQASALSTVAELLSKQSCR